MSERHEPFDTLAATHALGALDHAELAEFEAHLAGCARCEATLRAHAETLAGLARATPLLDPPPEVKEALLERVGPAAPSLPPRPWLRWVVAVAAALVSAWFTAAFVAARYEAHLGQMARESAARHARLEGEVAALNEKLAAYRRAAELLGDPATRVVTLHGTGPSPKATGRVIWQPAAGGHLFVAHLPPAPEGKAYELWTIGDAAPAPAGVLAVDAAGNGSHRVAPVAAGTPVKVFTVTLEPAGGVPAPTGPIVLASTDLSAPGGGGRAGRRRPSSRP